MWLNPNCHTKTRRIDWYVIFNTVSTINAQFKSLKVKMVKYLVSCLISPPYSSRIGPAGLHHGWGSQHSWRHCFSQVIPGPWPHELRPWLGFWGGAEALPHLCQMARRASGRRRGEVKWGVKEKIFVTHSRDQNVSMKRQRWADN